MINSRSPSPLSVVKRERRSPGRGGREERAGGSRESGREESGREERGRRGWEGGHRGEPREDRRWDNGRRGEGW